MSSDNLVTQGFIHGIKGMMLPTRIVRRSGGSKMTSILTCSFSSQPNTCVSSVVESMMNVLLNSSLFCMQYCVILDRIVPKAVFPPNWRKHVSLGASFAIFTWWTGQSVLLSYFWEILSWLHLHNKSWPCMNWIGFLVADDMARGLARDTRPQTQNRIPDETRLGQSGHCFLQDNQIVQWHFKECLVRHSWYHNSVATVHDVEYLARASRCESLGWKSPSWIQRVIYMEIKKDQHIKFYPLKCLIHLKISSMMSSDQ